jgi:hypothetical protein
VTILSVAYPFAPVGPAETGGAEQILRSLDRGLAAAGHRSLVLACRDSAVTGELIEMPLPAGMLDDFARREAHSCWRAALIQTIRDRRVDVVHLHGVDFHHYLPPEARPWS